MAFAIQSPAADPGNQNKKELQSLDQEINSLKKHLEEMRKNALNNEIKAQPYMFDNWHQFAEDIRLSEENEKNIQETKKKLQELNDSKEALLKKNPLPK